MKLIFYHHQQQDLHGIVRIAFIIQKLMNYCFSLGALNPYCEITVGSVTLKTSFIKRTNRPKWNESMEFLLYNLSEDIIRINIFDHEFFSPNGSFISFIIQIKKNNLFILENIAYMSMRLTDILPCSLDKFRRQPLHTFTQTIYLNNGASLIMKYAVEFLSACE
jgi:hypothetical protein